MPGGRKRAEGRRRRDRAVGEKGRKKEEVIRQEKLVKGRETEKHREKGKDREGKPW